MGFILGMTLTILFVVLCVLRKLYFNQATPLNPPKAAQQKIGQGTKQEEVAGENEDAESGGESGEAGEEAGEEVDDEKEKADEERKQKRAVIAAAVKQKKKLKNKEKKKAAIELKAQTVLAQKQALSPSATSLRLRSVTKDENTNEATRTKTTTPTKTTTTKTTTTPPKTITRTIPPTAQLLEEEGKFVQYDAIDSVNVPKMYHKCMNYADTLEWVVTEKIHGANLSINMTKKDDELTYSLFRRNGPLQASDSFYGCRAVIAKLTPKLAQVYDIVTANASASGNTPSVTVFGELFGGHYPHPEVPAFQNTKFVQKGLWYCPEVRFCAFDIVVGENYLPFRDSLTAFRQAKLFHSAPLSFKTTKNSTHHISTPLSPSFTSYSFDQCSQWNVESFETTVPELLGLPKLTDNLAEGIVIRTLDSPRLLIKKKSAKFAEISTAPSQATNSPNALLLSDRAKELFAQLSLYVTEPRLQAVVSRQQITDRQQVASLLLDDVFTDFLKSFDEDVPTLDRWDEKALRAVTLELCLALVAHHWMDIVEGQC